MFDGRAVRRRTTDSVDLHNSQEVRTSSIATGASHSHQSMIHTYGVPETSAPSLSRKRGMDQLLQIPHAQDPCSLTASAAISPATPLAVPEGATTGAAAAAAAAKAARAGRPPSHAVAPLDAHASSTSSEAQLLQQPAPSPSAPATPHMAAGTPCNPAPAIAPGAEAAPGGANVHLSRPADWMLSAGSFTGAAVAILQRRKDPTRTVTSEIVWAPRGGSITQERPPSSPAVGSWLAAASSGGSGSFTQALEEFNAAAAAAAAEGAAGTPPSPSPAAATCSNAAPASGHACLQTAGSSVPLIPAPRMMEQQEAALVTHSVAEPAAVVEAGHGGAGAADAHDCEQCVAPCSHCKTTPATAAAAAAAAVAVGTEGGALASSTTISCSTAGADTATITSCEGAQSEDDMDIDLSVEHLQHSHEHLPDLDHWEGSWWGDVLQGEEEAGAAAALLGEPLHVVLPQLLSLQALGSELQLDGPPCH